MMSGRSALQAVSRSRTGGLDICVDPAKLVMNESESVGHLIHCVEEAVDELFRASSFGLAAALGPSFERLLRQIRREASAHLSSTLHDLDAEAPGETHAGRCLSRECEERLNDVRTA